MSAGRTISNALGANTVVSDWRTGKASNGADVDLDQDVIEIRANAAIAVGQAVGLVLPTASVPPSGTPQTAAMTKRLYVGAALNAATAAGQVVQVCVRGFCRVSVGAGAPAAGDLLVVPATTTGVYDTTAVAPDATTVIGTIAGVVLGTKDSANLAFAYLEPK